MTVEPRTDSPTPPAAAPADGDDDVRSHGRVEERHQTRDTRRTFSPAQIAAAAVGGIQFIVAAVILLRTFGSGEMTLTTPDVTVGWLHGTPLMGLLLILLGTVCISVAATPYVRSAGGSTVGVVMVTGSIIGLIEPAMYAAALGIHTADLITYLLAGVALLAASWLAPIIDSGRTVHNDTIERQTRTDR